jgi:hypothetical protein
MELTLGLSSRYGGPPTIWLDMSIEELFRWVMKADEMIEKEKRGRNVQIVGPGL